MLALLLAIGLIAAESRDPRAVLAGPCDPPVTNPIVCENSKPGNPASEWDVSGAGDPSIQGFATDISVNKGETVSFKIETDATAYRLDIYRLGYYGGMGARKVATVQPSVPLPQNQPACLSDTATGLIDCGNWAVSASWTVPAAAVSGVYIARAVRTDTGGASHIVFIVRDDSSTSDILFQTSDTTWQAYNSYGGNSLYTGAPVGRAYKVSYNRPFITRSSTGGPQESFLFNAEYPMIRWLEANGYNVSYFTGVDTDRRGQLIKNHKIFLSVGHDEYWSAGQRANVEAARDAGVHLAFFSGNEVFWKIRWENSIDGSGTPYRTMVCYKETLAGAKIDPTPTWTGTWRDPRFSPPADGGRPENALTGTLFMVNGPRSDAIQVSDADGKLRFWRNTSLATLAAGQVATLPSGTLGYEWDEDRDNGFRPTGLFRLSSTTVSLSGQYLLDYGGTYGAGTATHSLTLYRAASGALVFGAGTVQWSWGLDANHDRGPSTPDVRMQQATVNLLADMGVQPGSLQPGLVPATPSTDRTPPTATITVPASGASVQTGVPTTITGTATDTGGVVAGVEISVDGGTTWHPASGRASWSYTWTPGAPGTVTIQVRAVDDSGNLQSPPTSRTVTVAPRTCPCSIWDSSATPAVASNSDSSPVELGVKFRTDTDGYITGLRFYKGPNNPGPHVGNLWTSTGQLLASATFTNETASGWQQASFSAPVPVNANVTYIASYFAPRGGYAVTTDYFATSGVDSAPLHALRDGLDGGNGVYRYGSTSGFPTSTYRSSNYWVDVVFSTTATDTVPPTVVGTTPAAGATKVAPSTAVTATFSEPINASSLSFTLRGPNNTAVPAAVTYDATSRTATLTPSAPLAQSTTYTASVSAADLAGNQMTAPVTWSFTTSGPASSIWDNNATPAVASNNDPSPVELGLKFRSALDGYITGIRFYKGPNNPGPHVGNLWTSTGQLLASATFTNETASGWQQALFSAPVAITANTTYVISYYAPQGGYALTLDFFASGGVDNYPLTALASGVDGGNGVYRYGSGGGFPTNTYRTANYWVDVVFSLTATDTVPPTVTAQSPAPNATKVPPTTTVTATFSEPVTAGTISFVLRGPNNTAVPASVSYDATSRTVTLTPGAPLALSTTYTATVSGAADPSGNVMAPVSWSFTTASMATSIWDSSATPAVASNADSSPVELGVKFRTDIDGYITGIRFYKGPNNPGPHTANLWTSTGQLLASATFTGETASGWQQALFSAPIAVKANTTYIASYYAPNGGYAVTQGYFATTGADNYPLHALRDGVDGGNGVYRYGGGFPVNSYQASNYWVDVVFSLTAADTVPPTVTARTPAPNATKVGLTTTVTATFSEPVNAGSLSFTLRDPTGTAVSATVSYDAASRTATLTPSARLAPATSYTATVSAADLAGNVMAPVTWSFTTASVATSIWDSSATPAIASQSDTQPVEVGLKFRSALDGYITGIRFYKGPNNPGPHVGNLWTSTGQLLASVTFTGETASGWQQALFPAPVAITANTTYVISYYAPQGGYALTLDFFASSGVDNYPLTALASGVDGGNGVYRYGSGGGFPTNTYRAANYWVDVVFSPK